MTSNKEKKMNNYWITYFKAIGILLMVIGHSGAPYNITNFIGLFHMAIFFFISGYLYKDTATDNIIGYCEKKVKSLYIPFVKWQIIFLLLHNILFNINIYNVSTGYGLGVGSIYSMREMIKNFFVILTFGGTEQMGGAMWFLPALFSTSIIFVIIRFISIKLIKMKSELITIGLVLMCLFVGKNTDLPRLLSISLVSLIVFWLGFEYKKIEYYVCLDIKFFFACVMILLVLNKFGSISMASNQYPSIGFFLVSSLCGIYVIIYISKMLEKVCGYSRVLMSIGKNTIYIVILHFISFKMVSILIINIYGLPIERLAEFPVIDIGGVWSIVYAIIGVLIPIIYVKIKLLLKSEGNN